MTGKVPQVRAETRICRRCEGRAVRDPRMPKCQGARGETAPRCARRWVIRLGDVADWRTLLR